MQYMLFFCQETVKISESIFQPLSVALTSSIRLLLLLGLVLFIVSGLDWFARPSSCLLHSKYPESVQTAVTSVPVTNLIKDGISEATRVH